MDTLLRKISNNNPLSLLLKSKDGGPGSGFFGHKGRKGKIGGSSSSNSLSEPLTKEQLRELLNDEDIKKEFGNYSKKFKELVLNNNGVLARLNKAITDGKGLLNYV